MIFFSAGGGATGRKKKPQPAWAQPLKEKRLHHPNRTTQSSKDMTGHQPVVPVLLWKAAGIHEMEQAQPHVFPQPSWLCFVFLGALPRMRAPPQEWLALGLLFHQGLKTRGAPAPIQVQLPKGIGIEER